MGNSDSRIAFKYFCDTHHPRLMFVAELMINFEQVPKLFWRSVNISKACFHNRAPMSPNLWALSLTSEQCIVLMIVYNQKHVFVATIYASTSHIQRRKLWYDLTNLQECFRGPWIFW